MGRDGRRWALGPMAVSSCSGEHPERMRRHPFLDFHRTAEDAGYPALLIVSLFALGLVVTPVLLLALTRAVWTLMLALLGIVAALALLAGEVRAAFADADEPGTPPR
jgi:hypothetical protein